MINPAITAITFADQERLNEKQAVSKKPTALLDCDSRG
jgi:hypothetical protein